MKRTEALKRIDNLKKWNSDEARYDGISFKLDLLIELAQYFKDNPTSNNGVTIDRIAFISGKYKDADEKKVKYSVEVFPYGTKDGVAQFLQKTDPVDNEEYIGYLNVNFSTGETIYNNKPGGGGDGVARTPPPFPPEP